MRLPPSRNQSIDLGASIEDAILACEDRFKLKELLGELIFVAEHTGKIDSFLRALMHDPVPGVTCAVLNVFRHQDASDEALQRQAAGFLTLTRYQSEWYDEAISAIVWAADHLKAHRRSPLTTAYEVFVKDARWHGGEEDILEFCRSCLG